MSNPFQQLKDTFKTLADRLTPETAQASLEAWLDTSAWAEFCCQGESVSVWVEDHPILSGFLSVLSR